MSNRLDKKATMLVSASGLMRLNRQKHCCLSMQRPPDHCHSRHGAEVCDGCGVGKFWIDALELRVPVSSPLDWRRCDYPY